MSAIIPKSDGIDTRKYSYSGNEILLGFDAEYYKPFNETLDLKFGVNGFLSHQKIEFIFERVNTINGIRVT